MRTFGLLFSVLLAFSTLTHAQKLGEPLPDQKGLLFDVGGQFALNVRLVDRHMQLIFVDLDGNVMECPFPRVVVHVERRGLKRADMHLSMQPKPGEAFVTHPRVIPPPNRYTLRIYLYPHQDDDLGRVMIPDTVFLWQD